MPNTISLKKTICYWPQPSVILQQKGNKFIIEVANDAYLQLLHTTNDNILERALFNTPNFGLSDINGSTSETLLQLIQTAVSTKLPQTLVNEAFKILNIVKNTIEHYFISFYITPILNNENKITEVLLLLIDNTEKVQLQQKVATQNNDIAKLEGDLKSIEKNLNIGRWEIDLATREVSCTDSLITMCGYDASTLMLNELSGIAITYPEDKKKVEKALNDALEKGTEYAIERRLIHNNGNIIHTFTSGRIIANKQGKKEKLRGFVQDITKHILQNEVINRVKANQEALINGTTDLIWSVDVNMHFLAVNKAFQDVMFAVKGKLVAEGQLFDSSIFCDEIANTWQQYFNAAITGQSVSFQQLLNFKHVSLNRYFHFTLSPIFNTASTVTAIACYAKDVNESLQNILKLENANNRLENIFAASLDIICSINGEGIFLHVSAASEKIWGYKPEEMVGQNVAVFIHPDDIEATFAEAPKVKISGVLIQFENRYITKTKAIVHMSWSGTYQAKPNILYCIGRDITEKKAYENTLISSKTAYQNLFDNNPLPMFIWDVETYRFIEVNTEALALYSYTKEAFVQLTLQDISLAEDIDHLKKVIEVQDKMGQVYQQGLRHKKKNGSIFIVDINAHILNYQGKKCSLVLINNVTEKLQAQKAIQESEAKYRSFFENSLDGILITKNDGQILEANPVACKLFQMTLEELRTTGRSNITDQTDTRLKELLNECEIFGKAKAEITHIRKDGSRFEAEVTSSAFTDAQGKTINALIIRDISDRKANEDKIKESNERFKYVTKATSDAIWDWDIATDYVYWGEGFQTIFGYNLNDMEPSNNFRINHIHPRDRERVLKGMYAVISGSNTNWEETYRFLKADNTYAQVVNRGFVIKDKNGKALRMVGAKRDISQYQYYTELEKLERNILAINEVGDKKLEEVLSIYLLGIEVLHPAMICSILQLNGNQLFNLASPSLPEAYMKIIDGAVIGSNAGSCGTAAFTKQNIIVEDIQTDVRWADYKNVAAEFGLRACWSHPILNQKEDVIATFATYYQTKKIPTYLEENTIMRASNILKIILESYARTQALKESNERYNFASKATSDAIWDWDLNSGVLIWGEGWQNIFDFDIKKIAKDISFKLNNTHPDDVERIKASFYTLIKSSSNNWEEEYQIKKANGQYAYVASKGFVIRDKSGKAIRMVGATRDITKKKQEELRLQLLESVITNTNDAVLITEAEPFEAPGPRIIYVNEAFTKLTGYTAEEVLGKTPRILQGQKSDREELDRLKDCLKKWQSCEITLLNYRKDGSEFWVNIIISPVANEKGWYTNWVAIQRDVTEKVLEEQNLTKAIIKAQENERYEIGGELHDNVCQILTSSQLSLKMLKKALGPAELQWYDKGIEAIMLASREIRNLSHRLAPSFFNDTTLELAITTLIHTFNIDEKYKLHIVFDCAFKKIPTKQEVQINLYRIVQEQLKNIFKYANATVIEVIGTVKNDKLHLEIIDNGVGFNIHNVTTGIGIANMKRRTELFSGKFEVQSEIGKGCKVIIAIPLEEMH